MKTLLQSLLLALGALALAGAAFAQVPSTNDTSDGLENTGMGRFALSALTTGTQNTASGFGTLQLNTTGSANTASGVEALFANTTGGQNTAFGRGALHNNTTGFNNTASGFAALLNNTTGGTNTASGVRALFSNTDGVANTASGYEALHSNTIGGANTASGFQALFSNTTGVANTASGEVALYSNTTGIDNTASGYEALYSNVGGGGNTASGFQALYFNANHYYNTAFGYQALHKTNGHYNIGVGYQAGVNLTTGTNNIDIGNLGVAAESGTIRIGTQVPTPLQTNTYIAGIHNNTSVTGGLGVVVDSNGQLGVAGASSERFKTAIAPMGSNTAKLGQLHPVTFHLKADPKGALQYGLIAEEVAKVYPELVIRSESGRIDGVRYDELTPMLLNEVQQQLTQTTEKFDAQAAEIRALKQEMAELKARK
jgi:trimeric autotransporter adhesin